MLDKRINIFYCVLKYCPSDLLFIVYNVSSHWNIPFGMFLNDINVIILIYVSDVYFRLNGLFCVSLAHSLSGLLSQVPVVFQSRDCGVPKIFFLLIKNYCSPWVLCQYCGHFWLLLVWTVGAWALHSLVFYVKDIEYIWNPPWRAHFSIPVCKILHHGPPRKVCAQKKTKNVSHPRIFWILKFKCLPL